MSEVVKRFLDDENWLYAIEEEFYPSFYRYFISHEGPHRFSDGECPCGVLDLGVTE